MTCYSAYNWLWQVFTINVLSYLCCCFISIHDRHVAIHKDQVIAAILVVVGFNIFDDLVQGFLTIICVIAFVIWILETKHIKYDPNSHSVVWFIINNQYFFLPWYFVLYKAHLCSYCFIVFLYISNHILNLISICLSISNLFTLRLYFW